MAPALRALLAPERIGTAMRDEAAFTAHQAALRAAAETHRERIEAVIGRITPGIATR